MRGRKWFKGVFLLLLLCVSMLAVSENASAAVKNGWVQKTYYYKDGKMLKNKWLTLNGKKYYFGKDGKAKKGVVVLKQKFYYFNKRGSNYNSTVTKRLRTAAKYGKNFASLKKLIGKPLKYKYYSGSCYGPGKDGVLKYSGFTVYTYKANGKEYFMGVE